ncbi:PhzF family phenazine biosynthesis protein [Arcobacter sp. L]|uniref:PhzF family phenazine biosynthesis protein n=1 Tax=Arcobacter sp. L TaxID=944547 RepID=UPI00022964CE|nr:PhzF family phenazine biosynthesis protein [Arcobacter sp. L]BAK72615.1 phenazine biosynthesis protein [Arcobacter sp. L]
MKLKIYQIDAFTDKIFKGNYAAVIILDEWLDEKLMQAIATENNLSETAFAKKIANNNYEIRWFSPITEIDFCGHATLATAYVLFEENQTLNEIIFETRTVGNLCIKKLEGDYIEMTFPNKKPKKVENIPIELINGLSIKPKEVYINQQAYFIVYENENEVLNIKVDLEEIKKLAPRDVSITSDSKTYDFISRYFWPANGGIEDPVTGSIHTGLAPLWAEKLDKNELLAYQASMRGGLLKCIVSDDKVVILGKAVKYLEGFIYI